MTELAVVSVDRKDSRARPSMESPLVELADGLERRRPRVCKNESISSSERWFSAPRARCSVSLVLRSPRESGSPDGARRRVKRRDKLDIVASRIKEGQVCRGRKRVEDAPWEDKGRAKVANGGQTRKRFGGMCRSALKRGTRAHGFRNCTSLRVGPLAVGVMMIVRKRVENDR